MMNESHRCYAEQEFTFHFCAIQSSTVQNESMVMGIRMWSGVGKVPGRMWMMKCSTSYLGWQFQGCRQLSKPIEVNT